MKGIKGMRRWACALALCLLAPAGALTVTEGVVESAPPVALMELTQSGSAPQEGYLPTIRTSAKEPAWEQESEYIPQEPFDYGNMSTLPRLTAGEAARAKALLAAYEEGEATGDGESVLEARSDVLVGVYRLDPEDFDGETVMLQLPGVMLSDGQLLAIIDAYHRLGLRFDPDALNERNCARGHAGARSMTQEELERGDRIRLQIETGVLDAEAIDTDALVHARVDMKYYYGSYGAASEAIFFPYRRMTDEEIAAFEVLIGARCEVEGMDTVMLERAAREHLRDRIGCPMGMELRKVGEKGWYRPWDPQRQKSTGELRKLVTYTFHFALEEGGSASADVIVDTQSGAMLGLDVFFPWEKGEGEAWIGDEAYLREAEEFARARMGIEGVRFTVTQAREKYMPLYAKVRASLPEGEQVSFSLSADGEVKQVHLNSGFLRVPGRIF